jgi:hypothetical protein
MLIGKDQHVVPEHYKYVADLLSFSPAAFALITKDGRVAPQR